MKKLFLFTWMMMLSIVAMAQTIMVIDKDGNRIPYDPAKVSSVDFQVSPPGFTVNHEVGSDLYLFDKVQSVKGHLYPRVGCLHLIFHVGLHLWAFDCCYDLTKAIIHGSPTIFSGAFPNNTELIYAE